MACADKDIKELLPAYPGQGIDQDARGRVEKHLEACKDCRAELSLLRAMAEEPIPDPGEAFWATMPERVFGEVQRQKSLKRRTFGRAFVDLLGEITPPRRAWAAASFAIVVLLSWFFLRPAPLEIAVKPPAGDDPLYEDVLTAEPVDIAGLGASELERVMKWADKEFSAIRDEAAGYSFNGADSDVYDELAELNSKELERLSRMLNGIKREV